MRVVFRLLNSDDEDGATDSRSRGDFESDEDGVGFSDSDNEENGEVRGLSQRVLTT